MVDITGLWSGIRIDAGSNNVAYNNLWYNCVRTAHSGVTISQSWYYNTQRDSDDKDVQIGAGNPFVDLANEDFRLSSATSSGKSDLGSPYNVDAYGNIRGSDGVWDRGAYEYNSGGGTSRPDPSKNLEFSVVP
jgi:hypothetical protein